RRGPSALRRGGDPGVEHGGPAGDRGVTAGGRRTARHRPAGLRRTPDRRRGGALRHRGHGSAHRLPTVQPAASPRPAALVAGAAQAGSGGACAPAVTAASIDGHAHPLRRLRPVTVATTQRWPEAADPVISTMPSDRPMWTARPTTETAVPAGGDRRYVTWT